MKHLWLLSILLTACNTPPKTGSGELAPTKTNYETYGYTDFTKEEKYAYHKHIKEGGSIRVGGATSRFCFLNFFEIEKHARIRRSNTVNILEEMPRKDVKEFVVSDDMELGGGKPLFEYLSLAPVDGMIVLHQGKIVFEGYPRMVATDYHVNFSVTKIYVSAAVAILEDKGLLSTDQSIDHYLIALKKSDWEGISIKDILAMASGIKPASSHQLLRSAFTTKERLIALKSAKAVNPPGTVYDYQGINTIILTLLVEEISSLSFDDFVEMEIWSKIGANNDGLLKKNSNGTSATSSSGMSSTLRDLARFGLAYTPSGRRGMNPIISDKHLSNIRDVNENLKEESWHSSETKHPSYQWDEIYEDGDFYKGGHAGQGLYISPSRDLVIGFYGTYDEEKREHQLPAISRQLARSGLFNLE